MLIAAETGDLVGSTALSPEELKQAISGLKSSFSKILEAKQGQAQTFRGDAYQIVYSDAKSSLRNTLLHKLYLLSQLSVTVNITQSLAIGVSDSELNNPFENMHPTLINSGRQLDNMAKGELKIFPDFVSSDFCLATDFLNRLINNLTKKQAEALYWYVSLDFPEQKVIANQMQVTRQNVNTHLLRSSADLVKAYILQFENNLKGVAA